MSQKLLHKLGMNTTAEEQGSAGVPEIVKAYLGQSRPLEERVEEAFPVVVLILACYALREMLIQKGVGPVSLVLLAKMQDERIS